MTHKPPQLTAQRGASTMATIAAFVAIGLVFLMVFFFTLSSNQPGNAPGSQADDSQQTEDEKDAASEPPYIRIPENSRIFKNDNYSFSFAYPDSFGELTSDNNDAANRGDNLQFQASSATASQMPVGAGTSFMNGKLSVSVLSKDKFQVLANADGVSVGPAKTGNDTTWKVVVAGSSGQPAVGSAYTVKSVKSQTGVTLFDFLFRPSENLALSRWVFEAGDHYVLIALPFVSKPSGAGLTDADRSAYGTIADNIAKTARYFGDKDSAN